VVFFGNLSERWSFLSIQWHIWSFLPKILFAQTPEPNSSIMDMLTALLFILIVNTFSADFIEIPMGGASSSSIEEVFSSFVA
jgi:hypothetical protein